MLLIVWINSVPPFFFPPPTKYFLELRGWRWFYC